MPTHPPETPEELYLDFLKRCLTRDLFVEAEPRSGLQQDEVKANFERYGLLDDPCAS